MLRRHDPGAALLLFRRAFEACPAQARAVRADLLYLVGLCLFKLGHANHAIFYWVESLRTFKTRRALRMLSRHSNEYGMRRQPTAELDDWFAFYAVHLERYLQSKQSHRLGTRAEHDMIRELIGDHYIALRSSGALDGACPSEKLAAFRRLTIVFPFFDVPENLGDNVVPVDFHGKRRLGPDDRCPCGSGLSFRFCCGRTRSEEELLNGVL